MWEFARDTDLRYAGKGGAVYVDICGKSRSKSVLRWRFFPMLTKHFGGMSVEQCKSPDVSESLGSRV